MSKDKDGFFYQYGDSGKKYYFRVAYPEEKQQAMDKAKKQMRAIHASKIK